MSASAARSAASTALSTDRRLTPGIDGIGSFTSTPSRMKIGQIRSAGVTTFSRAISRSQGVRRRRRGRAMGKGAKPVIELLL